MKKMNNIKLDRNLSTKWPTFLMSTNIVCMYFRRLI